MYFLNDPRISSRDLKTLTMYCAFYINRVVQSCTKQNVHSTTKIQPSQIVLTLESLSSFHVYTCVVLS